MCVIAFLYYGNFENMQQNIKLLFDKIFFILSNTIIFIGALISVCP